MRDKFDRLLSEKLTSPGEYGGAEEALRKLEELNVARDYIKQLEDELQNHVEDLCAAVATELRKLLGRVNVTIQRGKCVFKYFAASVEVAPDVDKKVWHVTPGNKPALREFAKKYEGTDLSDYKKMTHALAKALATSYKTLQGGKVEVDQPPKELPDDKIDDVLSATDEPTKLPQRAIERKGTSKTPGGASYS